MSAAKARRAWPFGLLIGFGIGFTLLMIGIGALFGLIVDERSAAHRQLDERREEIQTVASSALRSELRRQLALIDDEIEAALADPLLPSEHLLLVHDGRQILPPIASPLDTRARALLDAIEAGADLPTDDADVRARLALVAQLPASYEAWLDHRRSFVLRADFDLASTLVAFERLAAADALDPVRAEALLRSGLRDAKGSIDGWLAELLGARTRLSSEDFEHMIARGALLARRALVRVDDVIARARVTSHSLPAALRSLERYPQGCAGARGTDLGGFDGSWLVRCDGERIIGHRIDIAKLERDVHASLGLPESVKLEQDHITTRDYLAGKLYRSANEPDDGSWLTTLILVPSSKEWDEARADADRRFWFKAIPLGGVGVLALIICGLALLLQRRRAAYIDLRSQLLAAVTHELKTPLASIRALAETLELRLADHPAAKDYPRRIVASSERLEFLVDNVLSFARLEREAWKPRLAPIAVADLAAWLAAEPVMRAVRPVDFSEDVPPGLTLVGDADLVRLMLSNLLDNAAKYALGDRVRVRFIASSDAAGVHLVLADDGPGLGEHDPERLFDDFRRGRVEGVRGTGLGLSICKMVMALHRGSIEVAATSPAGTTFVATFPTVTASAELLGRPVFTPGVES